MTKVISLQNLYVQLVQCKEQSDYLFVFQNLAKLSDEQILKFVVRTCVYKYGNTFGNKSIGKIRLVHPEYFWNSEFAKNKADLLFKSKHKEEFLFGYFGTLANCNQEINQAISSLIPNEFIKVSKISQALLNEKWFTAFDYLSRSNISSLKIYYKEISFLFKILKSWEGKRTEYYNKLLKYNIDEILIQVISYFEKYKRSSRKVTNNRAELVSHEVALCYVLTKLLNDFKKNSSKLESKHSEEEFYKLLHNELPPLNPAEGIANDVYLPIETISDEKKEVREIVEFYFSMHAFRNNLDKYCVGFASFEFLDEDGSELKTNDNYKRFIRNDYKNKYNENYYLNAYNLDKGISFKDYTPEHIENEAGINSCIQQFSTLKIPEINEKIKSKDFVKIIELLQLFSKWFMPQGRLINVIPEEETSEGVWVRPLTIKKDIPEDFSKLFKTDYLIRHNQADIIDRVSKYFSWPKEEAANIIDFLIYDLNKNYPFEVEFLSRPLIKVGDNVYWLSSLLRDRHWGNLMHTRIVKDKLLNTDQQSKDLEKSIAEMFDKAKFKSVPSYEYGNGEGEIDTIAYKDGVVFFIELKTTYTSEDLLRQSEFDNRTLEYKAGDQLSRAVNYFTNNFDELKNIQELGIDKPFEEIKFETLIISNVFDWDDTIKSDKHLKVSLLELEIILKNRLFYLLNIRMPNIADGKEEYIPVNTFNAIHNSYNHKFVNANLNSDRGNCDLWNGDDLSASKFIEIVSQKKVWSFIDKYWDSNVVELFTMKQYDNDYKWLE